MKKRTFLIGLICTLLGVVSFSEATIAQEDAEQQDVCRAAIYRGSGASENCVKATMKILESTPQFVASFISADEIKQGNLKSFDVVLFPGGTATGESKAIGEEGWKELRAFVENGGGYLGTCAGAYMGLLNFGGLINARQQKGNWRRGKAMLEIEFTEEGRQVLMDREGRVNIQYVNGPIFLPADEESLKECKVLAYFRTEVANNDAPKGIQVDSPAIAYGEYGKGRVVICSPHPELTPDLNDLVPKLVKFAAQK